jgi:hypothetical protein
MLCIAIEYLTIQMDDGPTASVYPELKMLINAMKLKTIGINATIDKLVNW